MKPTAARWRKFLLRLFGSIAVLGIVALFVDVPQVVRDMGRLRTAPLLLSLAAFVALHLVSALKWRWYATIAGADIPKREAFRCHAAGLFGNLCLPSMIGGDVLRAGLAMKGSKTRGAVVVASVVDRISDLTALLALSLLALPLVRVDGATPLRALPIAGATFVLFGTTGALTLRWTVRSRFVRKLPKKLARVVLEVAGAVRTMRRDPLRSFGGWVLSVAIQSGFLVANIALGNSMGLELTTAQWFLLWPLAKIVAMMPISLGGLGVRELAFKHLVAPFGNGDLAVSVSLAWQICVVVGGLSAGAFWMASSREVEASPAKA